MRNSTVTCDVQDLCLVMGKGSSDPLLPVLLGDALEDASDRRAAGARLIRIPRCLPSSLGGSTARGWHRTPRESSDQGWSSCYLSDLPCDVFDLLPEVPCEAPLFGREHDRLTRWYSDEVEAYLALAEALAAAEAAARRNQE